MASLLLLLLLLLLLWWVACVCCLDALSLTNPKGTRQEAAEHQQRNVYVYLPRLKKIQIVYTKQTHTHMKKIYYRNYLIPRLLYRCAVTEIVIKSLRVLQMRIDRRERVLACHKY